MEAPPAPARVKESFKLRLARWFRARRIRKAVRLVKDQDGVVVSGVARNLIIDRLAEFAEWADNARLNKRLVESFEFRVADLTRLAIVAAELGDPSLQLNGIQDRYVNIRLRSMSRRKRQTLEYEAALKALEKRISKPSPKSYQSDQQPVVAGVDPNHPEG